MKARLACLFLLLSACEQTQAGTTVATHKANGANDPIPVQPQASSDHSGPFHGTIAELRELAPKSGVKVTIDAVVITALTGNAKTAYGSDPAGGAFSGILIQIYNSKSSLWATVPTVDNVYSVTGTYLVTTDGEHMSIVDPTLTSVVGAGPTKVPKYEVYPSALAATATNNADARGVYVSLDLESGPATVTNVEAPAFVNSNYSADMEAACRGSGVPQDTAQCCPSVGPKYFGFEITVDGTVIGVSTANYPSKKNGYAGADLIVWPCNGDFTTVLKTGTAYSSFGGIFDMNYGTGSLTPAVAADVVLAQ